MLVEFNRAEHVLSRDYIVGADGHVLLMLCWWAEVKGRKNKCFFRIKKNNKPFLDKQQYPSIDPL